jgi:hypothetical protein
MSNIRFDKYKNIIKNAVEQTFKYTFGNETDEDGRLYISDAYKYEFDDMFSEISSFLYECKSDDVNYKPNLQQLAGILIYHWMTFGLHSIVDFKGFEIMANMILGQID